MAEEKEKKTTSIYGTGSLDRLNSAEANLNNQLASRPAQYQNQYEGAINSAMDKVLNRQPFQYDVNGDALYKQYSEQFQRMGKQAMRDTIGQGAALTGGYDNSYAQNVGQQAYQGYMQQLTDKIPELYQLALDKYDRDATADEKKYALLTDRENQDYSRYNDNMSLWMNDRDFAADSYNNAFTQAMTVGDALSNRLLALAEYGYTPTEDELEAMGMTADQWTAWASQYKKKGSGVGFGWNPQKKKQTGDPYSDYAHDMATGNGASAAAALAAGGLTPGEVAQVQGDYTRRVSGSLRNPERTNTGGVRNYK